MTLNAGTLSTLLIAALASAGVIARPWKIPEAVWALSGAAALFLFGLLTPLACWQAVGKGLDVYLFLAGMMLLSELARQEGLFDYLAAQAARQARGSASRLFVLIYAVGTVVTIFMSNDATAVVMTPAVCAAARVAKARPLPYVLTCAFIANAASFMLPISNPANLVVFQSHLPALGQWLLRFGPASLLSIGVTFVVLRYTQRETLRESVETAIKVPELSAHARTAACGIGLTAGALMAASQHGTPLGWPTCLCGVLTVAVVLVKKREAPWNTVKDISWGVLPLVAGLFVLVAGLEHVGVIAWLSRQLHDSTAHDRATTAWTSGLGIAFACNLMNNLPAGLIAGFTVNAAHAPPQVAGAMLVGVDLGPNLSVTGSLATILWLAALRREGQEVGAWEFLKIGLLVMPAALIPALAAVVIGVR